MSGLLNSVFWRSLSEGLYVFHDPELLRGKKNVLIILAQDRANPQYQEALALYETLGDELKSHDVAVRFEDHPGGLLHEKFQCGTEAFRCFFINKAGDLLACGDQVIDPPQLYELLRTSDLDDHQNYMIL